jgi:hypothetical protein
VGRGKVSYYGSSENVKHGELEKLFLSSDMIAELGSS